MLGIGLVTVSSTRSRAEDISGDYLEKSITEAGHSVKERLLVIDDKKTITKAVRQCLSQESLQVVITCGGTGFRKGDCTIQAIDALIDTAIPGFGELFRAISYEEIGTATIQSQALAGFSQKKLVFCLPGSLSACKTGWERILKAQLDNKTKPCNFAELLL